jgi:predicted DNA binding CopG/RHH family protein
MATRLVSHHSQKRRRRQKGWISFDVPTTTLTRIKEMAKERGVTYQRVIKDILIETLGAEPK